MTLPSAAVSVAVDGGDVNLRASVTDATFSNGPSFKGVTLSLEKPGSFSIDYYVNKKDIAFEFMDTVRVLGKPLNLKYMHWRGENLTQLDGTLVLGPANKLSANYGFGSRNCRLKYSYLHGGSTSFEPCYDFAKNSWELAVSTRVHEDDVRASYQSSSKNLGLEWSRNSKQNGGFRILASLNLGDKSKVPILSFHQILPDL